MPETPNVLPPTVGGVDPSAPAARRNRDVASRLTPLLAQQYCTVPSVFLEHYHELKPPRGGRCFNSTDAMVVVQLLDFKWDERAPFPTVTTLARRMGLTPRTVRMSLKYLQDSGFLVREHHYNGGPNRYHLGGLFSALEKYARKESKPIKVKPGAHFVDLQEIELGGPPESEVES